MPLEDLRPFSQSEVYAPARFLMDVQRERRAQEKFNLEKASAQREEISKHNNKMLDFLWKAATDDGMPRAFFENMRGLAQGLANTMSPQQQTQFSAVFARGFFSKQDKLKEEYRRIYGDRPNVPFETITQENIQQVAEAKVGQYEYDYGMRAHLAGGKENLSEDSRPGLIPVGSFTGKEGEQHNIFGYKNAATGLVGTLDTATDIPGDLYNEAKKQGWGPTMMARHDFIPFKGQTSQRVTMGDKQYLQHAGIKMSTGESQIFNELLGDVKDNGSSSTGPSTNINVPKVIGWMNRLDAGMKDAAEKAGPYGDWVERAEALKAIKIKPGDTTYDEAYVQFQLDWMKSFPGTIPIARIEDVEYAGPWPLEVFFSGHYSKSAQWNPLNVDGIGTIEIDGKPTQMWYKEDVPAIDQKHVWFNKDGHPVEWMAGTAPGGQIDTPSGLKKQEEIQAPAPAVPTKVEKSAMNKIVKSTIPPALIKEFLALPTTSRTKGYKIDAARWSELSPERRERLLIDIKIVLGQKALGKFTGEALKAIFMPWKSGQFHGGD